MSLAAAVPGGSAGAWPHVKAIMQGISAKAGAGDEPCCQWVGNDGAGHYVKMVHNGIEYGDMQLICEAYHLMGSALGMGCDEMAAVFAEWNQGELDSFLIEITASILKFKDGDGQPLVEKISDTAGQKGTGKWTSSVRGPSTQDSASSACMHHLKARGAPTHPGAPPEQPGSLPWPQ